MTPSAATPPPLNPPDLVQPFQKPPIASGQDACSEVKGANSPSNDEAPNPAYFFIAQKDGWVHTALAYWIEGDTVHYITPQGSHNQLSIALVDDRLSEKLNSGRIMQFTLPKK